MEKVKNQKHFVLVHGACHGAWCWYKLKPLLESSGHQVTALDMAASGIHMKAIQEVQTLHAYTEPLLDFLAKLPRNEKVILVGHSLGGFNLAVATDQFPEKIAVAVYLTAFMPDTDHRPSFVLDEYNRRTPSEAWLDTQFSPYSTSLQHLTTMLFGQFMLSNKLYQLSPTEAKNYSTEGYGSVTRVYVLCDEDKAITEEFQNWMITNYPAQEVIKIEGADHMPMFSKPKELCHYLSMIAQKYA
ncbi:methylesterase 1 isoform X2 [Ricinus communis]|uniref:methylesterase 1 isoform X2 n=1 Tax=Ricinus communis TaxID=3988 RepID=UPI00201AD2EE|nr:methylesterase 1 isoform X2 [Ricinus communis]